MDLFFDTETSGLYNFKLKPEDPKQPWIVQLACILSDRNNIYHESNIIIKSNGRSIQPEAESVHCISVNIADRVGIEEGTALQLFRDLLNQAKKVICHNFNFDSNMIQGVAKRAKFCDFKFPPTFCTMQFSTPILKLKGSYHGYKWPKLQELHKHLFGEEFEDAHDALADVKATRRCYYELIKED